MRLIEFPDFDTGRPVFVNSDKVLYCRPDYTASGDYDCTVLWFDKDHRITVRGTLDVVVKTLVHGVEPELIELEFIDNAANA